MQLKTINARDVRLPADAVEALESGEAVAVARYGKRSAVLLSDEDFALVEPLLDLLKQGLAMPAEMTMTAGDIALEAELASDREPSAQEDELIERALRSSAG